MKLLLAAAMPPRPSFNTWKSVRDGGRRKAHFGGNFTSEHFLFIFVANFGHFAKNTLEREYSIANSQFFKQKIFAKNRNFHFKISKFCHSCLPYEERVLTIFYFHIFNIAKLG